jgi:hypothetical protein
MMKWWLRMMLVGLCVGAVAGSLLSTADAKTAPHKKAACAHTKAGTHKRAACAPKNPKRRKKAKAKPHKKGAARPRKTATVPQSSCGYALAWSPATWMDDISDCLSGRKLSQIVIPGSHDSTTYSINSPPIFVPYAQTQDEDLTSQLNGGIRQFDIRVLWLCGYPGVPCGYHARHGSGTTETISTTLLLPSILTSIDHWATAPGHKREVILLNLQIDQSGNGPFPTEDCQNFGATLGGSLVTPNELERDFGTTDPGEVTLGQLWSLPDPKGAARVIMNNDECMDAADPTAGQWSTFSSGYYADQCTADGDDTVGTNGDQDAGTKYLDLGAAQLRATEAPPGEPYLWGPPAVGGLYELDIQGTPQADCLTTPWNMLSGEQEVLAALYNQYLTDAPTRQNLNIVEADFVDQTDLMDDVRTMDLYPVAPAAPTITGLTNGDHQLSVAFSDASFGTSPITDYQVTATDLDHAVTDIQDVTSSPFTFDSLTNGDRWVITVTATSDDGTSRAAQSGPVYVGVPAPPTFTTLTCGDGQAGVAFSEIDSGIAATSYTVSATDLRHSTAPPVIATGPSSPVTVKGLTNADPYEFTLTATNADGSGPSVSASACQVGVPPEVVSGPANGTVNQPYSSGFTITGAPPPTVTLISGDKVPGLTLDSEGKLAGTPTQAGRYTFTVRANNGLNYVDTTATVVISPATLGAAPPLLGGRRLHATVCATRAGQVSACAVRTLIGTFPPLDTSAAAALVRGTMTYAAGRASAHYRKVTLSRRRAIPAGSYTLIVRRAHDVIFVPVTVQ